MPTSRFARLAAVCAPLACAPFAALAASPASGPGLSSREKLMLAALALSAAAMIAALVSMLMMRRRFKDRLKGHAVELRKAFAEAYVGMKDGAAETGRVREAERLLERIVDELERLI